MSLRKKLGRPAGGNVQPAGFSPEGHKQVIQKPRETNQPGSPARIAQGIEQKTRPTGHRPGAGQDRPS